jgi:molybdopterin-guanine dinucleotide biosynthesis protein A
MLKSLIGIIACGGMSSRMKADKSLLNYHGLPQRYYLYDLLKPFCSDVFISCNEEQVETVKKDYKIICDKKEYAGNGPVSGLLSAFAEHPENAVLFVGCDYPFFGTKDLQNLIEERSDNYSAICYRNTNSFIPEPLLAIYEKRSKELILQRFLQEKYSLREFLISSDTQYLSPLNNHTLKSVDTPEQYRNELVNFRNVEINLKELK